MRTIWKFSAPVADDISIEMPAGAEVLCVQVQGAERSAHVWAHVDSEAPKEARRFHWRGTGHRAEELGRYVGTIQLSGGSLVFHLFEASR